jgi:hypothetical protein
VKTSLQHESRETCEEFAKGHVWWWCVSSAKVDKVDDVTKGEKSSRSRTERKKEKISRMTGVREEQTRLETWRKRARARPTSSPKPLHVHLFDYEARSIGSDVRERERA